MVAARDSWDSWRDLVGAEQWSNPKRKLEQINVSPMVEFFWKDGLKFSCFTAETGTGGSA